MCIRDRPKDAINRATHAADRVSIVVNTDAAIWVFAAGMGCLLYTSDAADDLLCVDLGGRRIIKKKNTLYLHSSVVKYDRTDTTNM